MARGRRATGQIRCQPVLIEPAGSNRLDLQATARPPPGQLARIDLLIGGLALELCRSRHCMQITLCQARGELTR